MDHAPIRRTDYAAMVNQNVTVSNWHRQALTCNGCRAKEEEEVLRTDFLNECCCIHASNNQLRSSLNLSIHHPCCKTLQTKPHTIATLNTHTHPCRGCDYFQITFYSHLIMATLTYAIQTVHSRVGWPSCVSARKHHGGGDFCHPSHIRWFSPFPKHSTRGQTFVPSLPSVVSTNKPSITSFEYAFSGPLKQNPRKKW